MDATAADKIPPGVTDTRIPQWILPHLHDGTRLKMRPDLLIIQGLSNTHPILPLIAHGYIPNLEELRAIQAATVIHLIELTYTSDVDMKIPKKQTQHLELIQHLQHAGWKLSRAPPFPGYIPPPTDITPPTQHPPIRQKHQPHFRTIDKFV